MQCVYLQRLFALLRTHYSSQVTIPSPIAEVPVWFPGSRLNWAENLLQRNDDGIACTATGESGVTTDYSFRELREMVREMAAAMRVQGVGIGDRVAGAYTCP
jgi:acetoacetyl-CoA synthetase